MKTQTGFLPSFISAVSGPMSISSSAVFCSLDLVYEGALVREYIENVEISAVYTLFL